MQVIEGSLRYFRSVVRTISKKIFGGSATEQVSHDSAEVRLPSMHLYRSKRPIVWLRLCALAYPLFIFCIIAQLLFVIYASLHITPVMMKYVLLGMSVTVFWGVLYLCCSSNCRCPLCRSGPLTSHKCVKHRQADRLFGSYRLRVAAGVLFLNRYRCPYCGESTALKVRKK